MKKKKIFIIIDNNNQHLRNEVSNFSLTLCSLDHIWLGALFHHSLSYGSTPFVSLRKLFCHYLIDPPPFYIPQTTSGLESSFAIILLMPHHFVSLRPHLVLKAFLPFKILLIPSTLFPLDHIWFGKLLRHSVSY